MRRRRRALGAVVLVAANAVACHLILGLDDHRLIVTPDAAAKVPDDCPIARRPVGAPNVPDSDEKGTYIFAMHTGDFSGVGASGDPTGYDLDGVCTCDPRDTSSHEGGPSCAPPPNAKTDGGCDGDGGIDNILAAVPIIGSFFGDAGALTTEAECGRSTLLVVLQDYNGQADDPVVQVSIMPSFGILEGGDAASAPPECALGIPRTPPAIPARWDGTDRWSTRTEDADRNGKPLQSSAGWVNHWQLVLDLATTKARPTVLVVLRDTTVDFGTPILTADITRIPGTTPSFRLENGVLAGRIGARDMLDWMGGKPVSLDESPTGLACDWSAFDNLVKPLVCGLADTVIPAIGDFQGFPCNALSLAFRFQAEPAMVGTDQYDPGIADASCTANPAKRCP